MTTSTASSGDDWLRSFQSSVATGVATSFIWPGSGGGSAASAGISQFGNARTAIAANSAVTGGYGDGFLLLNRNHVSLHHIGSTWTGILGHSSMVDYGAAVVGQHIIQSGKTIGIGSVLSGATYGSFAITFPVASYTTPPFVQIQSGDNSTGMIVNVSSITTGGFISNFTGATAAASAVTVIWESDGT